MCFLFVFIAWDNEHDSYLKVETQRRGHITTAYRKPLLCLPGKQLWGAEQQSHSCAPVTPLQCPQCLPQQAGIGLCLQHRAAVAILFFCHPSGNLRLPLCCCCPSFHAPPPPSPLPFVNDVCVFVHLL